MDFLFDAFGAWLEHHHGACVGICFLLVFALWLVLQPQINVVRKIIGMRHGGVERFVTREWPKRDRHLK